MLMLWDRPLFVFGMVWVQCLSSGPVSRQHMPVWLWLVWCRALHARFGLQQLSRVPGWPVPGQLWAVRMQFVRIRLLHAFCWLQQLCRVSCWPIPRQFWLNWVFLLRHRSLLRFWSIRLQFLPGWSVPGQHMHQLLQQLWCRLLHAICRLRQLSFMWMWSLHAFNRLLVLPSLPGWSVPGQHRPVGL